MGLALLFFITLFISEDGDDHSSSFLCFMRHTADCLQLEFAPCQDLGYSHFSLPNLLGSETVDYAVEDYYYLANDSLNAGCTMDPTLFCGFAFPPCSQVSLQTLPCLAVCQGKWSLSPLDTTALLA